MEIGEGIVEPAEATEEARSEEGDTEAEAQEPSVRSLCGRSAVAGGAAWRDALSLLEGARGPGRTPSRPQIDPGSTTIRRTSARSRLSTDPRYTPKRPNSNTT